MTTRRRLLLRVAVLAFATGTSATLGWQGAVSGSPGPSSASPAPSSLAQEPSGSLIPSLQPSGPPDSTPSPALVPAGPPILEVDEPFEGMVTAMGVQPVLNQTQGWLDLWHAGRAVALDKDGGVLAADGTTAWCPRYLEPGGTGYLAIYLQFDGSKEEVDHVETTLTISPVADNPDAGLAVEGVSLRSTSEDDGTYATGFVVNDGPEDAENVDVCIVLLADDGTFIGKTTTFWGLGEPVPAGARVAFSTQGQESPAHVGDVAAHVDYAVGW